MGLSDSIFNLKRLNYINDEILILVKRVNLCAILLLSYLTFSLLLLFMIFCGASMVKTGEGNLTDDQGIKSSNVFEVFKKLISWFLIPKYLQLHFLFLKKPTLCFLVLIYFWFLSELPPPLLASYSIAFSWRYLIRTKLENIYEKIEWSVWFRA